MAGDHCTLVLIPNSSESLRCRLFGNHGSYGGCRNSWLEAAHNQLLLAQVFRLTASVCGTGGLRQRFFRLGSFCFW